MKKQEAQDFLEAFADQQAKDIVKTMMIAHYTAAIRHNHPEALQLDMGAVKTKCTALWDEIFSRIAGIQHNPEKLVTLLANLSRTHKNRNAIWFAEFEEAYRNYKHHTKLQMRFEQLRPFFMGHSYADIGCGGGDLVAYIKQHHPDFTTCSGIDIMDWRTPEVRETIDFQQLDFSRPNVRSSTRYDTLTCMAVLHHVGNEDASRLRFLTNLQTALAENGRLIVEEDVILPREEWEADPSLKAQIEKHCAAQPLFGKFVQLDKAVQTKAIILIDLLANSLAVGVPDMPFPFGFKTVHQWQHLFARAGLETETTRIEGFSSGKFNRSTHALFILKRK